METFAENESAPGTERLGAPSPWPHPSSRFSMAERAGFVWLMPPEADSPAAVVVGPSRRLATPSRRVCTSSPVPAGAGRDFAADFAEVALRGAAAFFFVVFAGALFAEVFFGANFFAVVFFATAFFAEEAGFFAGFAFAVAFFVVPAADFLLLDFLPDVLLEPRAAIWILPFALRA